MPHPEAIAHYPRSLQVFIKKLYNRVEKGKNALVLVVGETGSGKSYSCIMMALALHQYRYGKNPDVDDFVSKITFKTKEFLVQLDENKKKQIYIWEESGINANNRNWQSKVNKTLSYLTQSFRFLQDVIFINLPCTNFLDKAVKQLLHYYVEARRIDKKAKICSMKPLIIQYNNRMDKVYYHNITMTSREGVMEIDEMDVPLAPKEYISPYEEKKHKWFGNLKNDMIKELEEDEQKKKDKNNPFTPAEQRYIKLEEQGITDLAEIAERMGCILKTASNLKSRVKRKRLDMGIFEKPEKPKIMKNIP